MTMKASPRLRATLPAAMVKAMKRFQMDRPIMVKRWRVEWAAHGRDFGKCPCGAGAGTMRKHRPHESHPSSSCRLCGHIRDAKRREKRAERYRLLRMLDWELTLV